MSENVINTMDGAGAALASEPFPTQDVLQAPRPSNTIRPINIEEVNRGYIVRIGCHTFAFSTKAELTTHLVGYINEPEKTEEKWFKGGLF